MTLRLFIAGQRAFGADVYRLAKRLGHTVVGVSAPVFATDGKSPDRLRAQADLDRIPVMVAGTLNADTLPRDVDLIVAAHSHDFIGKATRGKTRLGGVGYHPSLLPRHRGRDAVRWTIHMGDPVAGGSVYWLTEGVDCGPIAAQDFVFVTPGETVDELWRGKLFPLGLRLIEATLRDLEAGVIRRQKQDPAYATWEPSWGRAPLTRPDLIQLGVLPEGMRVDLAAARA